MSAEQLLTTLEVAERLQLSVATLQSWRSAKKGPAYVSLGARRVRYRAADVDQWVSEQRTEVGR